MEVREFDMKLKTFLIGLTIVCVACVGAWLLGTAMRDKQKDGNETSLVQKFGEEDFLVEA